MNKKPIFDTLLKANNLLILNSFNPGIDPKNKDKMAAKAKIYVQ